MRAADARDLFAIYGDAEVMRTASDPTFTDVSLVTAMLASVDEMLATGESIEWGVAERSSDRLMGTCGLHGFSVGDDSAEVGCLLARAQWGRGIMREALVAMFAYAKVWLGLTRLRADIDAANERSIKLFEALGFRRAHDDSLYERDL